MDDEGDALSAATPSGGGTATNLGEGAKAGGGGGDEDTDDGGTDDIVAGGGGDATTTAPVGADCGGGR